MLLLLGDGTRVQITELPGRGPWTFVVLRPDPRVPVASDTSPEVPAPQASAASDPEPGGAAGGVAGFLTRFGRAVVPDLRGRPGWSEPPGSPGFLDLVDDLDQVRTRAGLGQPILVGLDQLALPALVLDAGPAPAVAGSEEVAGAEPLDNAWTHPGVVGAVERLLGRLGGGPGWAGIAPDAPPR